MDNQLRVLHKKQPSIATIRPKALTKVEPIKMEPYLKFEEDVARAEQAFKNCKNFQRWDEINREIEEIIGVRLNADEQGTLMQKSERLSAGCEEKECLVNDASTVEDCQDNDKQLVDSFKEGLNFSQSITELIQTPPPRKNNTGKDLELPITKSLCGMFTFQRNSKAEFVLQFIVRIFHFLYAIGSHKRTQTIFVLIVKIAYDLFVALALGGISLLIAVVTFAQEFIKKSMNERKQLAVQPSQELIQTFGPRPLKFDE